MAKEEPRAEDIAEANAEVFQKLRDLTSEMEDRGGARKTSQWVRVASEWAGNGGSARRSSWVIPLVFQHKNLKIIQTNQYPSWD
jgi:hypothetical protein